MLVDECLRRSAMVAKLEPVPSKVTVAQKSPGEARGACDATA